MAELNRRSFFKLVSAAAIVAAVPQPVVDAVGKMVADDAGTWIECDGALLDRNSYAELFSVIGLSYGGDSTTFRLPDMRGLYLCAFPHGGKPTASPRPENVVFNYFIKARAGPDHYSVGYLGMFAFAGGKALCLTS